METKNDTLHMFQKNLDDDTDMQSAYIKAENVSDSSDAESCKIVLPKRTKKKHVDTSQELLFQLLRQHKELSKTQKKMYELQSEIDREDVVTRYIKLDLNNTQVKLDETEDKFKVCKNELTIARTENWVTRVCIVMYIFYQFYSMLAS